MSVSSDQVRLSVEAGNGVTVEFDFDWKIFAKTDLKCWKVSAAGVYTLGVVDVDYTVTFSAADETGTVTWTVAPVSGGFSVIAGSEMAFTQGVEFPRDTAIPNSTFRNAFDRACILIQQLSDVLFNKTILWDEELYLDDREQITITEAPVDRRALMYERNSTDDGWNIVPSSYDSDVLYNLSAALAVTYASGLIAARTAAPTVRTMYYATDTGELALYIPDAGRWFTLG